MKHKLQETYERMFGSLTEEARGKAMPGYMRFAHSSRGRGSERRLFFTMDDKTYKKVKNEDNFNDIYVPKQVKKQVAKRIIKDLKMKGLEFFDMQKDSSNFWIKEPNIEDLDSRDYDKKFKKLIGNKKYNVNFIIPV